MAPYIFFLIINSFLLALFSIFKNRYIKKGAMFMVFFNSVFFSGFRYNVGKDYLLYVSHIDKILKNDEIPFELGAYYLVKAIDMFHLPIYTFFFITSLLVAWGFFKFIKAFSINASFSVFLFLFISVFYLASFNLVRQFVAISLFLVTLVYLQEKKNKYAIMYLIIACLFHKSVIILIPLLILFKKQLKLKTYLIIGITFFILIYFSEFLILKTEYAIYLVRSHLTISNRNSLVLLPFWVLSFFFILLFYNRQIVDNKIKILYVMNYFSFLLITCSFFSSLPNMFFLRVNSYVLPSFFCLLPIAINTVKPKGISFILYTLFLILTISYYLYNINFKGDVYNLVPYEWWI